MCQKTQPARLALFLRQRVWPHFLQARLRFSAIQPLRLRLLVRQHLLDGLLKSVVARGRHVLRNIFFGHFLSFNFRWTEA
ncbi:Uncharacterised protein [Enterobacter cancerogenus]|uniref:Uncharacterized protein n=1 Tax=Enterobacter cancerogenus TaxID=69218 RepID=A0A484XHL7_9ENTR|nr:Uncharacterised protein [Enterobacter cancerogenus]